MQSRKKGRGAGYRETKTKRYRRPRTTAATRSSEICQGTKRRESEEAFKSHGGKEKIEAAKAKEIQDRNIDKLVKSSGIHTDEFKKKRDEYRQAIKREQHQESVRRGEARRRAVREKKGGKGTGTCSIEQTKATFTSSGKAAAKGR